MNKHLIVLFFIAFGFSVFGQQNEELKEKMDARKIAFLTDKLDLSPEEAQKFWPEYNAYTNEIEQVKSEIKETHQKRNKLDEKGASDVLTKSLVLEERMLNIKKEYVSKMKSIIGPKKTLTFFQFDRIFKERLLKRAKERRRDSKRGDNR